MRPEPVRVDVVLGGPPGPGPGGAPPAEVLTAPLVGPGPVGLGPLEVTVGDDVGHAGGGRTLAWSVANRSDRVVRVRSVGLVMTLGSAPDPVRFLRHGYQSWSPTGVATLGVDTDPSARADFEFVQGIYHADQRRVADGELRSEWVTVLHAPGGPPVLVGFDGGTAHDGTLRLRRPGTGAPELTCEAFLGGVELAAGEDRPLHGVAVVADDGRGPSALLAGWAAEVGDRGGARTGAPFQVGWCSWYHYFHGVTEEALRANLARADAWPFEVFQLDDGYQAAIGDWRETNERFPSGLEVIAADIREAGRRPGLWLAPFLAAPDSRVALDHPDWLAREAPGGDPLFGFWNPPWGGGRDGFMYALDTTHPEVLEHLARLAADLVAMGWGYLKLDFTFAPSFDGVWRDAALTPAQRVRAGFTAIRRGAGDDAFLLGCGAPLAPVVGLVDGNRIGPDVAPLWALGPGEETVAGYADVEPATRSAWAATAARSFMHRRLWLNDPDCVMLRTAETGLDPAAARTWAHAVGVSGGMVLVSDDLSLLGADQRALLDETTALGRAADAEAVSGRPARCTDLLESSPPTTLEAAGARLTVDAASGVSELSGPRVGSSGA